MTASDSSAAPTAAATKKQKAASRRSSESRPSSASSSSAAATASPTTPPFCCCRSSSSPSPRYLVVGLGNPGAPFVGTRHNIGRDLVQTMQTEWNSDDATTAANKQEQGDSTPMNSKSKKRKKGGRGGGGDEAADHVQKICASRVATISATRIALMRADDEADGSSESAAPPRIASASAVDSTLAASCTGAIAQPAASHDTDDTDALASTTTPPTSDSSSACRCHILLATLDTPMNLSGRPVSALSRHFRVPARRLILVYDDISLPIGTIRVKTSGRSGGQRGVESVLEAMGGERQADGMVRIRIGVAPTNDADAKKGGSKRDSTDSASSSSSKSRSRVSAATFASGANVAAFVMRPFSANEQTVMREVQRRVRQAIMQVVAPTKPSHTAATVDDAVESPQSVQAAAVPSTAAPITHDDVDSASQTATTPPTPAGSADAAVTIDPAAVSPPPTSTIASPSSSSDAASSPPGVVVGPPPCECRCAHAWDSNASLAQRLQHTMTRFNGAHVAS